MHNGIHIYNTEKKLQNQQKTNETGKTQLVSLLAMTQIMLNTLGNKKDGKHLALIESP